MTDRVKSLEAIRAHATSLETVADAATTVTETTIPAEKATEKNDKRITARDMQNLVNAAIAETLLAAQSLEAFTGHARQIFYWQRSHSRSRLSLSAAQFKHMAAKVLCVQTQSQKNKHDLEQA
jgi:hypothetical protein